MDWNPFKKLTDKIGLTQPAEPTTSEGMAELKKQGMLGTFFRRWKDPAFKKQMEAVSARMKADGVDLKDKAAVEAWVNSHKKEIESGSLEGADIPKVETVVKMGPDVGRNDPCPCGSGKKYKKCCAGKN